MGKGVIQMKKDKKNDELDIKTIQENILKAQNPEKATETENAKKKPKKPSKITVNKKTLRYGGLSALLILVMVCVMVAVNVFGAIFDDKYSLSADLTSSKLYSVTQSTLNELKSLNQDITIITTFQGGSGDNDTKLLLSKYAAASKHITVKNIYPDTGEEQLKTYDESGKGIDAGSIIVTNSDNSKFKVIGPTDLSALNTSYSVVGSRTESRITNAIHYVATGQTKRAVFLAGHNETSLSSLNGLLITLDGLNYELTAYSSSNEVSENLNPKTDILFVISPLNDLPADDYQTVSDFLDKGGDAVFLMNNVMVDSSTGGTQVVTNRFQNFDKLLEKYDIYVNKDIILNPADTTELSASVLLLAMDQHDITKSIIKKDYSVVLTNMSSLQILDTNKDVKVSKLLTTNDSCYQKVLDNNLKTFSQESSDKTGPFTVGVAAQRGKSKIVVIPSSYLVSDTYLNYPGDAMLLTNIVKYMTGSRPATTIAAKSSSAPQLQYASTLQVYILIAIVLVLIPVALLVAGIIIWRRRRKL